MKIIFALLFLTSQSYASTYLKCHLSSIRKDASGNSQNGYQVDFDLSEKTTIGQSVLSSPSGEYVFTLDLTNDNQVLSVNPSKTLAYKQIQSGNIIYFENFMVTGTVDCKTTQVPFYFKHLNGQMSLQYEMEFTSLISSYAGKSSNGSQCFNGDYTEAAQAIMTKFAEDNHPEWETNMTGNSLYVGDSFIVKAVEEQSNSQAIHLNVDYRTCSAWSEPSCPDGCTYCTQYGPIQIKKVIIPACD